MIKPGEDGRPGTGASAREVYDYAQAKLQAGDSDAWMDTFADDGVMEIPLAPPGIHNRIEGREEIRRIMKPIQQMALAAFESTTTSSLIHECDNGSVIVHEFVVERKENDQVFRMPYVHVVTVRDGEYVTFHDYASFGTMPSESLPQVLEFLAVDEP